MALRILTGVLVPESGKHTAGEAIIHFNPHQVTGDADGENLQEWGDRGDFNTPPSAIVSLKRIRTTGGGFDFIDITEDPPTTTQMEVEWQATGGAHIHAISYMIIGEA